MTRVLLLAAALAFASSPPAAAQQTQNLTEQGCGIAADMTLVARALAVEKVGRALAGRIMAQVYVGVSGTQAAVALRERVIDLAYSRTEAPMDLARLVGEACLRTGGDQGAMFGTSVRWRQPLYRGLRL